MAQTAQDKATFNGGEAATPFGISSDIIENGVHSFGLTKREYFAAMALQGKLAGGEYHDHKEFEAFAKSCVKYADALLLELEK